MTQQFHARVMKTPAQARHASDVLAELVGPTGTLAVERSGQPRVAVPAELGKILEEILATMARGGTVTIGCIPDVLTTSAAARLLGISRPTLMKMIDDGTLASHKVGTRHRLKSKDVTAALRARRERERAAFAELLELEGDDD